MNLRLFLIKSQEEGLFATFFLLRFLHLPYALLPPLRRRDLILTTADGPLHPIRKLNLPRTPRHQPRPLLRIIMPQQNLRILQVPLIHRQLFLIIMALQILHTLLFTL